MNTALRTMTVLACLLALGACTTQEAYENIRASERQKCSTLPQTEYERCMRRTQDNYGDYKKKRDEVTRDADSARDAKWVP